MEAIWCRRIIPRGFFFLLWISNYFPVCLYSRYCSDASRDLWAHFTPCFWIGSAKVWERAQRPEAGLCSASAPICSMQVRGGRWEREQPQQWCTDSPESSEAFPHCFQICVTVLYLFFKWSRFYVRRLRSYAEAHCRQDSKILALNSMQDVSILSAFSSFMAGYKGNTEGLSL